ncbi:MAG TPA: phenylacetate--CoA ligase family protein, partial [Thermoplasmatales archaeon]|nr:phenylacetate--CoA ligase family protein [Thermoplasmatales archaeon]
MGIEPNDLKLHSGLFGAEMFTKELKKKIQNMWGIDVHDIYGLTEMCGPGVSTDCDEHDGLHLWEDHFLVEVVDPVTLEPVDVEEEGELVITTLTKEGVPILRYRTRDISKLYDVKVCNCGRTHVKHAPIKGRSDDMIIIRGTNIYPGQIETVLMKNPMVGNNWRMILTKEGEMDQLIVEVESNEKLGEKTKKNLEKLLTEEIKSVITLTPKVTVLPPKSIPMEGLKAKRVVDKRNTEKG